MKKILFIIVFYLFTAAGFSSATVFLDESATLSPKTSRTYTFEVNQPIEINIIFQHADYFHTIPWTIDLRTAEKKKLLHFKSPGGTPEINKTIVLPIGRYTVKISASHQVVKKQEYRVIVQATTDVTENSSPPPISQQVPAANKKSNHIKKVTRTSTGTEKKPIVNLPLLSFNTPMTDSVGSKRKKTYQFKVEQAGLKRLRFAHARQPHRLPWSITLKDGKGNALLRAKSIGLDAITTRTIGLPKGQYSLQISCSNNKLLHVEFILSLQAVAEKNVELEYNNNLETATPMALETVYSGILQTLPREMDVDYYTFSLAEEGNVVFQFQHKKIPSDISWNITLLSAEKRLVTHKSPGRKALSTGEMILSPGTYYLKVDSNSKGLNGYNYTIGSFFELKEHYVHRLAAEENTIASLHTYLDTYPTGEYVSQVRSKIEDLFFKQVQDEFTIQSFTRYLTEYKHGRYRDKAVEMITFLKAEQTNTVAAFEDFLNRYPQAVFKTRILTSLEKLLYEKASAENSIAAFNTFLKRCPSGKFHTQALTHKDQLLYEKSRKDYTVKSFDTYLKEFPQGIYYSEARKEKAHLLFYAQVSAEKSISAYDDYLKKYPKGKYTQHIQQQREQLFWDQSKKKNSFTAYNHYLTEYPTGKFSSKAKKKRERRLWEETIQINTVAAFDKYLKEYPQGRFLADAKREREQLFWSISKKNNTVEAFEKYLNEYPAGDFIVEAKQKKETLLWTTAKKSSSIDDLDRYLREYPQGKHLSTAIKRREELFWQETKKVNTIAAYDKYLKEFPTGKHIKKGRQQREILFWKKIDEEKSVEGYCDYLQQYPAGKYVTKAKKDLEKPLYLQAAGSGNTALYDKYLSYYPDGKYIQKISMELIYYKYENLFANESNSRDQYSLSEFKLIIDRAGQNTKAEFIKRSKDNLSIFNCSATCVTQVFKERKGTSVGNVGAFDKDQAARLYRKWNPCGRITYFQLINRASTISAISQCRQGEGQYNVEMDESYSPQGRSGGSGYDIVQNNNTRVNVSNSQGRTEINVTLYGSQSKRSNFISIQSSMDESICEGKDSCYMPYVNEFPVEIVVSFSGFCGTFSSCYKKDSSALIRINKAGTWHISVHVD